MDEYKEKLMEYCEEQMSFKFADERLRKNWVFGAVEFARRSGLIDEETANEILEGYGII